jgi:hypothetical protein
MIKRLSMNQIPMYYFSPYYSLQNVAPPKQGIRIAVSNYLRPYFSLALGTTVASVIHTSENTCFAIISNQAVNFK